MPSFRTLNQADIQGKRVLLRAGFDLSIENGQVMDTERIEALVPTMQHILRAGASLIIMSHQGRPKGKRVEEFSQRPIVPVLEKILGQKVSFADSCIGPETEQQTKDLKPGEALFLENLRYKPGEEKNDPDFTAALAKNGDVYVNDAFTNCHRNHASMVSVPTLLPAYMGLQLEQEVTNLSRVFEDPKHPLTILTSGAKMETKVPVIKQFLDKGENILLGGCIANTFIAAQGYTVAKSKYEEEYLSQAKEFLVQSGKPGVATIHVPTDAILTSEPSDDAQTVNLPVNAITDDLAIFDIGRETIERYCEVIRNSKMIIWNGPLGYFEKKPFAEGTRRIAEAILEATKRGAISIIGGGDTIDFHTRYNISMDGYTFVSTGGGAMLEFIGGKKLQAIELLRS